MSQTTNIGNTVWYPEREREREREREIKKCICILHTSVKGYNLYQVSPTTDKTECCSEPLPNLWGGCGQGCGLVNNSQFLLMSNSINLVKLAIIGERRIISFSQSVSFLKFVRRKNFYEKNDMCQHSNTVIPIPILINIYILMFSFRYFKET